MKILSIFGTRPEALKMSPICSLIRSHYPEIDHVICLTAQHKEMLDPFLELLKIDYQYYLNLMEHNQSLASLTSKAFIALDEVIKKESPDWILVQGDTTTAMVGAMVAFYNNVKIGHIEAGLRTHNNRLPFPEEVNRKIIDIIADLYFAPTELNKLNLINEQVDPQKIFVTGNTIVDALIKIKDILPSNLQFQATFPKIQSNKKIILVTAHRREHFGESMQNMCDALLYLAQKYKDQIQIVLPVHLNPNVKLVVESHLSNISNILLLPPLDYISLLKLIEMSFLLLTDSGGIQEEAPSFKKPVLITRDSTERRESVDLGFARLVGKSKEIIINNVSNLLDNPESYNPMIPSYNPYGDGCAAERILQLLISNKQHTIENKDFCLTSRA